jgi:hypothetical protein
MINLRNHNSSISSLRNGNMEAGTWYRDATPPNKSNAIDRSIDIARGDLPMLGPYMKEDPRAMNPSACARLECYKSDRQ